MTTNGHKYNTPTDIEAYRNSGRRGLLPLPGKISMHILSETRGIRDPIRRSRLRAEYDEEVTKQC